MALLDTKPMTKELDLMEIFDEMMRLDSERSGVGHVLVLMGSRKMYAELFAKACENVLDKQTKV